MGVPVSKLKVTTQSVTLIVEQSPDKIASKYHQDPMHNLPLIHAHPEILRQTDETAEKSKKTLNKIDNNINNKEGESNSTGLSQLKYIDDNETSEENDSFRKATENDTDSGNASISSDSHHEDSYEIESKDGERAQLGEEIELSQLRRPRKRLSTLNFYSTLTNRLSTVSFANRCSTQSVLSQFEQSSIKKLISKLKPGDLIEIRCLCNCLKSGQLRASLNHRQRFRRTLQRQSFHQMPLTSTKRPASINLSTVFPRSCISGSMSDMHPIVPPNPKTVQSNMPFTNDQCSEQFHYVLVQRVDSSSEYKSPTNGENVWCFHVRPYQRVALLEDDRHLGVVKYETLDLIVGQFLIEMEERHWQFGRGFKQPKLSVYYQIRNQEKLSQTILKQTLNAQPNFDKVVQLLMELKDSYVRYHRTQCNSEHYATLWKYGIGWSTWVNARTDIVRTLQQFIQSFSQLVPSSELQLQGGECILEQTNLIVHCFGLHGSRLEESIRQWIHSQVVITKSACLVLSPIQPSHIEPVDHLTLNQSSRPEQQQQQDLSTEIICVLASEAETT